MTIRNDILQWIQHVSKLRPEIGGFAICPFAKQAKYDIIECKASEIIPIDGYQVLIYVVENEFNLEEVQNWVKIYNKRYPEWKFFEDCASYDTYINGIQSNNGKYNLILAQPREKLRKFREILAKTNYYNYWSNDYLKEILEEDINLLDQGIETP
ncbi:MAG: hypothetical protein ACO3CQ_00090 [Candidatus Nanopelagicaceae bacterium]